VFSVRAIMVSYAELLLAEYIEEKFIEINTQKVQPISPRIYGTGFELETGTKLPESPGSPL